MANILLPSKLQIEVCDICNLNCSYCDIHKLEKPVGFMSFEKFKELIDQAYFSTHIYPQFWGESTLHKDFENMLEYCKAKNKYTSFYTNATHLHRKDMKQVLKNTDLINISIQSTTREHYQSITQRDFFDLVVENIKNLWSLNKQMGSPCRLIIRAAALNPDQKSMELFSSFWQPVCHEIKWKPLRILSRDYAPFAEDRSFPCGMLSDHCIVKCDGSMVICCTDHFGDIKIGNVFESSILEVLNSDSAISILNKIGTLQPCRNCWYRYSL